MTEALLIILIAVEIIIHRDQIFKIRRKVKPDEKEKRKAEQKRREFENFISYSGDKQI